MVNEQLANEIRKLRRVSVQHEKFELPKLGNVNIEHDIQWSFPLSNDEVIPVIEDDDHFEVELCARYFAPNEIEVKAIGELLEIHLEHNNREDESGMVSRCIDRCYKLPKNVDARTLKSNLDSNGVLHIAAKKRH